MKNKKRLNYPILFVIILCIALFAGCQSSPASPAPATPEPQSETPRTETQNASTDGIPTEQISPQSKDGDAYTENAETNGPDTQAPDDGIPIVYMTTDISPESLMAVYAALGATPTGNIAIKVHTGEPPNSNYLRPALIKDLVQSLNGTIVETNSVAGNRSSNAKHLRVAKDHGFLDIAEFDLLDADGEISIPITIGEVLSEVIVGANVPNYDYYVVLSHFKGHASAGYGGAIKNVAIGLASAPGKSLIHSGGKRRTGYTGDQDNFLKGMAEATKAIVDSVDGNFLYINVMNRLSVDCDCMGNPASPDMHDIGILASFDPVALDQACVDLIYAAADGASLIKRIESRNGIHTLEHAEAIGLGSRVYHFVSIDE